MNKAIVVESLVKCYGNRTALDELSFTINEGELFCLLGPNGSGKTTLFRILCTLLSPDSGRVLVAGRNVVREAAAVRQLLGVVFQHPSLDEKLTVKENLRYGGNLYGLRGRDLLTRMKKIVEELQVNERLHEYVETLSGGLRRRVEIAKALLTEATILLLDEPSTGIDPIARLEFWSFIDSLRRQRKLTVIFTTHLMDEAERSDRVAIIDQGQLIAINHPAVFLEEAGPAIIRVMTPSPAQVAEIIQREFGLEPLVLDGELRIRSDKSPDLVLRLSQALEGLAESFTMARPTMDDVFLMKTGHRFTTR